MFKKRYFKILIVACIFPLLFISIPSFANGNYGFNSSKGVNGTSKIIRSYDQYYNAVKDAMSNYDSTLTLNVFSFDKNVYNIDVFNKVLQDNPQLQGICTSASMSVKYSIPIKMTISFKYIDSKENLQNKEKILQKKIHDIISTVIKPGMKDYEKEAALHDYVVNNSKYDERFYTGDMPKDSNTAYGVLINGTGACEGYSQAMYKLLQAVGIESTVVIGDANDGKEWVSHAWNIVKIGGQYYHLDTTWDDPVMSDGSNSLRHSYFNLTDEQIMKNHRWNKNDYPQCNSTTFNFNNLNLVEKNESGDNILVIKNYNEFYNAIKNALSNNSEVSVKILNYDANVYNIEKTINKAYNALSKGGSYSWTNYTDEISNSKYITITFK